MAGRFLSIAPRVKHALVHQQPLVFLESAIITHGLPSSHSSVPLSLERIVESHGAVPSTVGILDGVIRVGLSPQEIERLANEEGREKAGVREIPAFVAQRKTAGLTVSGTMEVMRLAGHQGVFVTGGIGGVHRGASSTFDISSDLPTLSRIPGMVVCSGPKSILDIPLTLEYLETLGVLVSTYRSTNFPAFYTSDSGCKSPLSFESFQEAARALWILNSTDRSSGMLLANPIPQKFEDRGLRIQKIVEETVKKAEEEGIHKLGKAVTPWILERVARETKGESIENNIALIENNARVGAQIAVEYSKLQQSEDVDAKHGRSHKGISLNTSSEQSPLAVVGCAAVDITAQQSHPSRLHTTVPGRLSLQMGGVARNIAHAATLLLRRSGVTPPTLIAPVATDEWSQIVKDRMKLYGMRTDGLVTVHGERTPTCTLVLDQEGGLMTGMADMNLVENWDERDIIAALERLGGLQIVCLDGNLSVKALSEVVSWCRKHDVKVAFEPTSDQKSLKILDALLPFNSHSGRFVTPLDIITPNEHEIVRMNLHHLFNAIPPSPSGLLHELSLLRLPDFLSPIVPLALQMTAISNNVFTKLGPKGVLVTQRLPLDDQLPPSGDELLYHVDARTGNAVVACYFPPERELNASELGTVVGAGDSMLAGLLAAYLEGRRGGNGAALREWVKVGMKAAETTLKSAETVGRLDELQW